MAKPTTRMISNGDLLVQNEQKKTRSVAEKNSSKNRKKPMKSNITNKIKPRRSNGVVKAGGDTGEDEDGGGNGVEEQIDAAEEPDVNTLPSAAQTIVGENTPRLAGIKQEDHDMFNELAMIDEAQVDAGAESDDGYADVENVSDSDDTDDEDDGNILRSAEKDLIDEFERHEHRRNASIMAADLEDMGLDDPDAALARRLGLGLPGADGDLEINMNEDPFFGLARNDNLYNDMWDEAESAIWRMPETVRFGDVNGTQKRVRFEETHSHSRDTSSATSEEQDPNEVFPDLFAASDDPAVKQRLALVTDDLDLSQNDFGEAESFYDFEDDDEKFAFEVDENSDSDSDSSSYDSDDEGDTTDEETREEQIARLEERKKATGGVDDTPSTPSMANRKITTAASTPPTPRPTTPRQGRGPKTGTFEIDPTRATITTEAGGRKIKLLPPSQPLEKDKAFWDRAKTANSSRTNSPPESAYLTLPSPAADSLPPPPFTAKSTLGSMFNGNLDILRNNDTSGIAEELFPAIMNRQSSFTTATTDDSDAVVQDVNMQDFLDMHGSDSDSDAVEDQDQDMMSSMTSSGLLDHFDQCRGVVGSFRRNQHQAKHFSSLPSHPAKRASTHEYNALQKGKRGAANTPMTPARKKRASQDFAGSAGIRKSVSSPLNSRRPRSRGNSLAGMAHPDLYQTLSRNPFE